MIPFSGCCRASGFVLLEAMHLQHVLRLVRRRQRAALLTCLFTHSFRVQALVFIAVSASACWRSGRWPNAAQKTTPTNGDRNLGREATVLTPSPPSLPGRVRLDGVDWNARCATPGDILTPGQRCRVTELHSTLLIVEPILTESITI